MRIQALVVSVLAGIFANAPLVGTEVPQSNFSGYVVDRTWPRPLPNDWRLGVIIGMATDKFDRIWVTHRATSTAGSTVIWAPPVLQFEMNGRLTASWGGPGRGFDWPVAPGGISVDDNGNVWVAAQGSGETSSNSGDAATMNSATVPLEDAHVLKFSGSGQFLLQIGEAGELGTVDSQTRLNHPAAVAVDTVANEVFVADGGTSQRVVVFDATTGVYKRHWRTSPVTTSRTAVLAQRGLVRGTVKPFTRLSSIAVSKDGSVYVGDRDSNCIQVFKRDGTGYTFGFVSPTTNSPGSVWAMSLTRDPQQFRLFVANGEQVIVLGRSSLLVQSVFGQAGTEPGALQGVGAITVDSKGNVYTGDSANGNRVQRFLLGRASGRP
jgi:DNA-binding beta-propeller fold protein YncE